METMIACRVVACREKGSDGNSWSYYLINDSVIAIDSAQLAHIGYEWGDLGGGKSPDCEVPRLLPGEHARIWRDDGSGAELRLDLSVVVRAQGGVARLSFEFPKLYLKKDFPFVPGLDKHGYARTCQACLTG